MSDEMDIFLSIRIDEYCRNLLLDEMERKRLPSDGEGKPSLSDTANKIDEHSRRLVLGISRKPTHSMLQISEAKLIILQRRMTDISDSGRRRSFHSVDAV
jgi:hypothetical protein